MQILKDFQAPPIWSIKLKPADGAQKSNEFCVALETILPNWEES